MFVTKNANKQWSKVKICEKQRVEVVCFNKIIKNKIETNGPISCGRKRFNEFIIHYAQNPAETTLLSHGFWCVHNVMNAYVTSKRYFVRR